MGVREGADMENVMPFASRERRRTLEAATTSSSARTAFLAAFAH
jgi:hypothetical protein